MMTHQDAIRWYLRTSPPTKQFAIAEIDNPRIVYKTHLPKFWQRLGELLRTGDRHEQWKDGTIPRLIETLQQIEARGEFRDAQPYLKENRVHDEDLF